MKILELDKNAFKINRTFSCMQIKKQICELYFFIFLLTLTYQSIEQYNVELELFFL